MVWVFPLKFGVYIEKRTLHGWLEVQNFSQSSSKIFEPFTALSSATFFNTLRQILYLLVLITKSWYPKNLDKMQGARKIIFTACLSGKLKLSFTKPWCHFNKAPKAFWLVELISQFSVIRIPQKTSLARRAN